MRQTLRPRLIGALFLLLAALCSPAWGDWSGTQSAVRRLLRWEKHVQSPFLLLDHDRLATLDRMKSDDVLKNLRSAISDRAAAYRNPDSPYYLGDVIWENSGPLFLRQCDLQEIRYLYASLLDLGFVSYAEHNGKARRDGIHLLLRIMEDLRNHPYPATTTSPNLSLIRSGELLAGLTLSYDLFARAFQTIDRGPFLDTLEKQRTFLSTALRHRALVLDSPTQRADVAACFGLVTLFSSALSANHQNRKTYQQRYRDFTSDLLWGTQTLVESWANLSRESQSINLEDLEYPAFFSVVFMRALKRAGGPDLFFQLPLDLVAAAVSDRKIPGEPLVIDQANADLDPVRPETWPPNLRNIFWNKGNQPGGGPPTPVPTVTPTPTPTPRPLIYMLRRMIELRRKHRAPTPTPTPRPGWSPPQQGGMPSVLGPALFFLAARGNPLAREIWDNGGSGVSSHPATLSRYENLPRKRRAPRHQTTSLWSNRRKGLWMIHSPGPERIILARQILEDGLAAGDYLVGKSFKRRFLERIKTATDGEALSGTDTAILSPGHVLSVHRQGKMQWTMALRTSLSLGLPYLASVVQSGSNTIGTCRIILPLQADEKVEGATSVPRLITVTGQQERTPGSFVDRRLASQQPRKYHLRLALSPGINAVGQVIQRDEGRFLQTTQPLKNGAALWILGIDSWKIDAFRIETVQLEKGFGIVIPWKRKGHDLIAVNTGEGIRGPTIDTDAQCVILSWDTTHNQVAYLLVNGTYLGATPSQRNGSIYDLVRDTRERVTVSWSGRSLVFAEGSNFHGVYYAPGLVSATQGDEFLVPYKLGERVRLSRKQNRVSRPRTVQGLRIGR